MTLTEVTEDITRRMIGEVAGKIGIMTIKIVLDSHRKIIFGALEEETMTAEGVIMMTGEVEMMLLEVVTMIDETVTMNKQIAKKIKQ